MNRTPDSNADIQNITTSTQRTHSALSLSLENQASVFLWNIWPPCLLLLGGFGNIATISVMRRIKDKNSSQHVILMALAGIDLSVLYVSLFPQWVYHLFHVDIYALHIAVCKLCVWLHYATSYTSSWLLTCVTIQRTMAVKWPHRMRVMCSLQRTWIVVAAVVTFGCTLHFHFLFGMVISDDNRCTFRSVEYEDFVLNVWTWVDLALFTLLPSLCLLICDIILSKTLFTAASSTSMTMSTITNSNSSHIKNSRKRTASRTTIMILTLSCTFLVLTLPVCICHLVLLDYYAYTNASENANLKSKASLAVDVSMLLWYMNSAVNFLLYCFTGSKFRGEFLRWIFCDGQVQSNASISKS